MKHHARHRILLILFATLSLIGCKGAEAYKTEVQNFQKALTSATTQVQEGADSYILANRTATMTFRTTNKSFLVKQKVSGGHIGGSNAPPPATAKICTLAIDFARVPPTGFSDTQVKKLKEAMKAVNDFASILSRLAGIDNTNQVSVAELTRLQNTFDTTSSFLSEVEHRQGVLGKNASENLANLADWFTAGSGILDSIVKNIVAHERRKAVKMAVNDGLPTLEKLTNDLNQLLASFRALEQLSLEYQRDYLALLLETAATEQCKCDGCDSLRLDWSDEYLIKQELLRASTRLDDLPTVKEEDDQLFNTLDVARKALVEKTK